MLISGKYGVYASIAAIYYKDDGKMNKIEFFS